MPVFTKQLNKVSEDDRKAIAQLADYIRQLQEELENKLLNLDSKNIIELDTDVTKIKNSSNTFDFENNLLTIKGNEGELFQVGNEKRTGKFVFRLNGPKGNKLMYINNDGNLIVNSTGR